MPITEHPSFDRPPVTTPLWRYVDLPKFIALLVSQQMWLTNAEVLASDDPHEGLLSAVQFPHRMWRSIDEVPAGFREQIIQHYGGADGSAQSAFQGFVMTEEQRCTFTQFGRRQFYVNCLHAANHESVAMWKIYGSPGAGVAIVTNGGRLEAALASNSNDLHLGAIRYVDPTFVQIGVGNAFDTIMVKRASFSYEKEVRLVYWDTADLHDPLVNFSWNDETMRFGDIVEDDRPIIPGMPLQCDLDVLIERVVLSPFAPPWYLSMMEQLKERLNYRFPIVTSKLLSAPTVIP